MYPKCQTEGCTNEADYFVDKTVLCCEDHLPPMTGPYRVYRARVGVLSRHVVA